MSYIIVTGDLVNGMSLIGPFPTREGAVAASKGAEVIELEPAIMDEHERGGGVEDSVVVAGSPVSGVEFFGPLSWDDASLYAEFYLWSDKDWWIADLADPSEIGAEIR